MSHYDCKNCDAINGIDFGYCKECTPKEYFEIQKKMSKIDNEISDIVTKKLEKERCRLMNKYLEKSEWYNLRDELRIIEQESING